MALADSAPKLIAEMLNTLALVGLCAAGADGDAEVVRGQHRGRHRMVDPFIAFRAARPAGCRRAACRSSPLARWYTSERCWRENGAASLSLSMKYWRISGRMYSSTNAGGQ